MHRRRSRATGEDEPARRSRGRELLLALPPGVVAAAGLWVGDMQLTRRDWLVGSVVFAIGLVATALTIRQLRRAGVVR